MGTIFTVTSLQFLRYAAIGIASNLALYLFYLALAGGIFEPKSAMTITYACGVLVTFLFNRRWTFNHQGPEGHSLLRYVIAYASGYVVNVLALLIFVDYFKFRHEIVQGCMIILLAILLFLLQKYWVFRAASANGTSFVEKVSPGTDQS